MEDILLVFYFKGKTYVGLKIAQALLDNHQAWSSGRPMLVVCYTNHALDQFLEGTPQTSIFKWVKVLIAVFLDLLAILEHNNC